MEGGEEDKEGERGFTLNNIIMKVLSIYMYTAYRDIHVHMYHVVWQKRPTIMRLSAHPPVFPQFLIKTYMEHPLYCR